MKVNNRRLAQGVLTVLAAMAMSGCLSDDRLTTPNPDRDDRRAVTFGAPDGTATRAKITSSLRKIGVMGYAHTGNFSDNLAARIPDYFLNQSVIDAEDNGTWTYSGVKKYWYPAYRGINLSFFAYAPYLDVEDTFTLYPQDRDDAGFPKIDYTVPAGIVDQIDLMWGNACNKNLNNTPTGIVSFEMNHALTKIDFKVKLAAEELSRPFLVEITELTVRNVVGGGTLDMSKAPADTGLWTVADPVTEGDLASYVMTRGGHGGLAEFVFDARVEDVAAPEWTGTPLLRSGQYLMLVPQPLDGKGIDRPAEVVLKYNMTNTYTGEVQQSEVTLPLSAPGRTVWESGVGITYVITLRLLKGAEIEFTVDTLDPWIPGGPELDGSVN